MLTHTVPMRLSNVLLTTGALAVAFVAGERDAAACGGCFPPQGEQQSVVTDHRMIFAVSKDQTTLYDQIQFTGSPSEFAWVLPIAGTVDVGLSADTLFGALDNLTTVVVQEPPRNCPPPPTCNSFGDEEATFAPSAKGSGEDPSDNGGVQVIKKEVVGPYETVQLASDNANALNEWLAQNGYSLSEDVKPVIAQYVTEKFNFLALKLRPGSGVQSMRPVRVTTKGASAVLPLRMVAAGTGANVGVTLWVVSEGRYETANFPSFVLKNEDLTWDWTTGTSNYKDLRAERASKDPGRTWETESSPEIFRSQITSIVTRLAQVQPDIVDYAPVEDSQGNVTKTAQQVRDEDLATLFQGIPQGAERVTRTRSDLSRAALGVDLQVIASGDQSTIDQRRVPKIEKGQPLCPIFDNDCRVVAQVPRDQAVADAASRNGDGSETFACKTANAKRVTSSWGAVGGIGAMLGLALVRARRAKKVVSKTGGQDES
jgi:hypothetical protein